MGFLLPTFDEVTERRFDVWRASRLNDALLAPVAIGALAMFSFLLWDWLLDPSRFLACLLIRGSGTIIMLWCAWKLLRTRSSPIELRWIGMLAVSAGTVSIALTQFLLKDGFLYGPAGLALFPTVSAVVVTRARQVPLLNLPGFAVVLALLLLKGVEGFALFNVIAFVGTGVFAAGILALALERTARYGFQLELKLEEQAHIDPLTGIANRRRLEDRAREEVERARRFNRPLSLMIMDLDHFKGINDRHGHPFGDKVLRALAALGRANLRQTDLFARVGGEEFVVLMPETTAEAAAQLAERLRTLLSATPVTEGEISLTATISIGIATHGADAPTVEALMTLADKALYAAKAQGRDRVVIGRGGLG
ncbi:GGDEF domain-containing protein [Niveispirillum sp.]|uniref:GGDEF domain-containing protein n=1 Tax=Niveispirillum sp. TaxID=1917217 RepID=UPI001B45D95C|nr:GGDEF domain-containing protein [Niveispirillum sp.]MBP7338855.1 GGDEF domain-containing protein [Niveispirillum sp.]